jgi:hypothetical protein
MCVFNGTLPFIKLRFKFFEDDSSRDVTLFFVRCGMSGKNTIHCFEKGFVIKHFTSKSTLEYLFKISHGNASQNECVDSEVDVVCLLSLVLLLSWCTR